jgi:hypothetical protein
MEVLMPGQCFHHPADMHRDESRRGTHECVRHITARICGALP